jgi:hypothetical protein
MDSGRMWPPQGPEDHAQQLRREPIEEQIYEYEDVPYGMLVQANFPQDRWSAVYYSWLSYKGFVVGLHYCEETKLLATQAGARVWATFVVIFSSPRGLAEWLQQGYPIEEMLADLGVPPEDVRSMLVRDVA